MTGRGSILWLVLLGVGIVSAPAAAEIFGTGDNQFTIDFITISGDASSANGTNISQVSPDHGWYRTFTDPVSDYRIGTYEITNDQFAKFATNNPDHSGTNIPANMVSWFEAAQFVNWLNTSTDHQAAYKFTDTGSFTPWESGDMGYDSSNPYRNSNAHYFLPTEDEWVKAAYWNGSALQTWATPDDTLPIEDLEANYGYGSGVPWNVGSGSEELNGTFDMMGNIYEWMENSWHSHSGDYLSGSHRSILGGSCSSYDSDLRSSYRYRLNPYNESGIAGFRVASVPEPTTLLLLGLGGLVLRRKGASVVCR